MPPFSAPGIADPVSSGAVGCHLPLGATIPTGFATDEPVTSVYTAWTKRVEPGLSVRAKKRKIGYAALTHVYGDCADAEAGSDSDEAPWLPLAVAVSLPDTT